ncbi:MAG: TauD/TfdA family dioxygenase [Novosphingobium sp.]|nr:TauD/TfdA family dioxygenase [Novosphingobium sp.]
MSATTTSIKVTPITPSIGAVVEGVDLREPLDEETVRQLREIWLDRGVIFLRDQGISEEQLERYIGYFGTPITEPSNVSYGAPSDAPPVHSGDSGLVKAVAERWHADASWLAEPPAATALRMVQIPEVGGDTCWSNVTQAYEDLIEPLRALLDSLDAVHWMAPSLAAMGVDAQDDKTEYTHPVIAVHPETGRRALFVSEGWTKCIVGLPASQGSHLLALVYDHIKSPHYTMRWRWAPGDIALWDNRAVQHFAVPDYDSGRIIQRVVTAGVRPVGPQ